MDLFKELKTFLVNNYSDVNIYNKSVNLVNEMPTTLREEVMYYQYG